MPSNREGVMYPIHAIGVNAMGLYFRIASDLYDHTERYRHVYLAEPRAWPTTAREHGAIHQACLAGDAVQASRQVARHLGTTALTIIALASPERDPVPVREALRMITAEAGEPW